MTISPFNHCYSCCIREGSFGKDNLSEAPQDDPLHEEGNLVRGVGVSIHHMHSQARADFMMTPMAGPTVNVNRSYNAATSIRHGGSTVFLGGILRGRFTSHAGHTLRSAGQTGAYLEVRYFRHSG